MHEFAQMGPIKFFQRAIKPCQTIYRNRERRLRGVAAYVHTGVRGGERRAGWKISSVAAYTRHNRYRKRL